MVQQVIRGVLTIDGHDLGEVVARVSDQMVGGHPDGTLIVAAGSRAPLPPHQWIPGWLAPIDAGPAFAIEIRRAASGGIEFRRHAGAAALSPSTPAV